MSTSKIREHKRIASWWLRFEDLNWPNHDGHDRIKRRAEALAEANATTAMIFGAHFRWDFLPYFTILHDYMATVAEELGKRGLELYDHHSISLAHRYTTREEMRHVILDSGPHLPFSPSREAAASWEFNGTKLNDWRAIDVLTGQPVYYPQYTADSFCVRNPQFREAYKTYMQKLVRETGITGLSADDTIHFMEYRTCGCVHCRAEFKRRTGIDLPAIEDASFWGNWDNPAWKTWIDQRHDTVEEFFKEIRPLLPEDFRLTVCGAHSASPYATGAAGDGRRNLGGCNYLNLEMSGNTPPYKHDPVTTNSSLANKMISASHHQGAAREKGVRCFGTGFGFTEVTANIVWAVNKILDADCWFSTLKDRLGLPEHILKSLPDEADVIGRAFTFEKEHPHLFNGEQIGQLAVFFSSETRDHTLFGNIGNGFCRDYSAMMRQLFTEGISAHTIFTFPKDNRQYPLIIIPSAASMTAEEKAGMEAYLASGGKVLITGPCDLEECRGDWQLPNKAAVDTGADFVGKVVDDLFYRSGAWVSGTVTPPCEKPLEIQEIRPSVLYTPHRMGEYRINDMVMETAKSLCKTLPVKLLCVDGYLINMFETDKTITVHMLAADYDTDIDHELDEMRFHRSRVNYINKVEPIGITQQLRLGAAKAPAVYTPFNDQPAAVTLDDGIVTIDLPEKTSYVILQFDK